MSDKILKNIGYRPTWVEVDLDALAHNLRQVKKLIAAGTKIMVCVKKDAYGHGLIPVAKKLVQEGVDYLSVASIDEAIALRKANITKPILVLGVVLSVYAEPIIRYRLSQTVSSYDLALALNKKASANKRKVNIHIKVDTGMGRIGVLYKDALAFIKKVNKLKFLNIEGVFTHFPSADTDLEFSRYQINLFNQLKNQVKMQNIHIPFWHAANSMAVIRFKESHFNMVRPGLMVYGLYPKANIKIDLRPVLSLKTRIVYLKKVPKGYGISYGHIYRTKRETTIATLPIGYGDGYLRCLSNKAELLIKGKRFRVAGRICMDQTMVDIRDSKAKIGDVVVLIGSQGKKERITAEELARLAGTIPYEIVCNIGNRSPRIYCNSGKV
jgi:alanine racemase